MQTVSGGDRMCEGATAIVNAQKLAYYDDGDALTRKDVVQLTRHCKKEPMLQKIDKLDLEDVKAMLCLPKDKRGEGWDKVKVNNIERRYKMFLKLCVLYPKLSHVPTADIDHMWHWHILFTADYRRDCDNVFGHYLNHNPREQTPEAEAELRRGYERTKVLFLSQFGETLPAEHTGDCSPFPSC